MASGSGKDVGVERRLVSLMIGPDVGSTEEQRPEDLLPASQSRPLLFKKDKHSPNQSILSCSTASRYISNRLINKYLINFDYF